MSEHQANDKALAAAVAAGPQQLRVTPQQLATLLLFEGQIHNLIGAATQLDQVMGLKQEAAVLASAAQHIDKAKVRMQGEWSRAIVIAQPGEVPKLVQP